MITILMATYNGERYLREQLDSLMNQTFSDFVVWAGDDCSTDSTREILKEYSAVYPGKIRILPQARNSGSPKYNFFSMMAAARDKYLMLCDQDDIWLPDKIEKTMSYMRELERRHGIDTPLLVHTDLTVVDGDLQVISPSFKLAMNADYTRTELRQLVVQNTLTGCTALYNRALAELLTQEPEYMIMHDWWLILVAGAFGYVGHVDAPTILYRQHGANEVGAKNVRALRYKLHKLTNPGEVRRALNDTYRQAAAFLNMYRDTLTVPQQDFLTRYCEIPQKSKLGRISTILRLGTSKNGIARKIAQILFI